jgi:hypothetical protein
MSGEEKERQPDVITLGSKQIDPDEEKRYAEMIARARKTGGLNSLKGSTPVGGIERPSIPILQKPKEQISSMETPQQGVQPRPPGSPILRPETIRQIEEAQEAAKVQKQEQKVALDEQKLQEDSGDIQDLLEAFTSSQTNVERILDNKARKDAIEGRCKPMSFEDLLIRDEVRQKVPIRPGEFEPTFRSITPQETLFIKTKLSEETIQTNNFIIEKYNLYLLTCGLVDINGELFPSHLNHDGDVDQNLFNQKIRRILRKSSYIIADLTLNYAWFDVRVRKLINPDDLKNG